MKIVYAGQILADTWGEAGPPVNPRLDGSRLVDAPEIVRATSRKLYPRGNSLFSFSFGVERDFGSIAQAERALAAAFAALPPSGPLQIECGAPGEAPAVLTFAQAAPQSQSGATYAGVRATLPWVFLCVGFSDSDDSPLFNTSDTSPLMTGKENLAAGALVVPVVFPVEAATPPVAVVAVYNKPTAGAGNIVGTPVDDSFLVTGFSVELTAPAEAGATLSWIAYF